MGRNNVNVDLPINAIESPVTQQLIEGIKWYFGDCMQNPTAPITLDILCHIVTVSQPANSVNACNTDAAIKPSWPSCMLASSVSKAANFAGFSSSVHLLHGAIEFRPPTHNPNSVDITFPASKSDPFQKGVTICIAAVNAPTRTVKALHALFLQESHLPNAPNSEMPMVMPSNT